MVLFAFQADILEENLSGIVKVILTLSTQMQAAESIDDAKKFAEQLRGILVRTVMVFLVWCEQLFAAFCAC